MAVTTSESPPDGPDEVVTAVRIKTRQGFRLYRFDKARRAAVASALRHMSGQCDGATDKDERGFNRQDASSDFVRGLVTRAWGGSLKGEELTDRQCAWALTCLWKYRTTQLEDRVDVLWPEGMDETDGD